MLLWRVRITKPDWSSETRDVRAEFAAGAREIVTKQIKDEGHVGWRITKVKLLEGTGCCPCVK